MSFGVSPVNYSDSDSEDQYWGRGDLYRKAVSVTVDFILLGRLHVYTVNIEALCEYKEHPKHRCLYHYVPSMYLYFCLSYGLYMEFSVIRN